MIESVRPAVPADGERFADLAEQFGAGILAQRGGAQLVASGGLDAGRSGRMAPLVELLAESDRLVVVGTLDDVVTGFATGHVEEFGHHGLHGVLDACFVEEGARGVGLGRLLLDEVLAWLDGRGCLGVDGLALPGDRDAKSFYEAAGFKARLLTMHRGTPDDTGGGNQTPEED